MDKFVRITILAGVNDWQVMIEENTNSQVYTLKDEKDVRDFMIKYFAEVKE